jgi:dTDP-glucose pyrophosphorylase
LVDLEKFLVSPATTLLEVMRRIDRNARGIALVVDGERRLLDTITDGDLRRAILNGTDLSLPVSSLASRRQHPPLTAQATSSRAQQLAIMCENKIRQLPLIGSRGEVKDLVLLDELAGPPLSAVVMAGGEGLRLRPLTEKVPKPMLPIGAKPLAERTVEQLRAAGVQQVFFATHYKSESLARHFGDGANFGVAINYLDEQQPLGTAGALARMTNSAAPLLIVNGDILTTLNYRSMLAFHEENNADMTVAVRHYEFRVPYGVVATDGVQISGLTEKPAHRFFVNAGIYLVQPSVCRYVPRDRRFDMTELIAAAIADSRKVIAFPVSEYWIDIGDLENYEKARADADAEFQTR